MDKDEFTAAVLAAEPTLYRVAKTMLRNEQDCADAAQQAILHAWERLHTLRSPQYFKTWLIRILINECQMILRKRKREVTYEEGVLTEEAAQQDYSDLYQHLMQLDISYRLPLVMYYFDGFKIREIADILEMSESAIKMRLNRGKLQLRTMFEKEAAI